MTVRELGDVVAFPITPMNDDESLDLDGLQVLVERAMTGGAHSINPIGSTAEFAYLDAAERISVIASSVDAAGDAPVIANITAPSVREMKSFVDAAVAVGASGFMINQFGYFALGARAVTAGVVDVALHAREAGPVVFYNQPVAGTDIPPELIAEMYTVGGIYGVKEASLDLRRIDRLRAITDSGFSIYHGWEVQAHLAMLAGARGFASQLSILDPRAGAEYYRLAHTRQWDAAQSFYEILEPFLCFTYPGAERPAVIKEAYRIYGLPSGPVRRPIPAARPAAVAQLEDIITLMRKELDIYFDRSQ